MPIKKYWTRIYTDEHGSIYWQKQPNVQILSVYSVFIRVPLNYMDASCLIT